MSVMEMSHHQHHHLDLEQGNRLHHHHLRRGSSIGGSDDLSCFSDAEEEEEEDGGSTYSQFYSTTAGSTTYDDYGGFDGGGVSRRVSSVSEQSVAVEEIGTDKAARYLEDEESKAAEVDCRICHLGLESNSGESGIPIELGCSCKADLAAAHKHCAEAWFKIKGNKTCEICNSVAKNVVGITEAESVVVVVDHSTESNASNSAAVAAATSGQQQHSSSDSTNRSFWQGHRFLNFLLACMVFAFVISWLFHFNVPSS